MNSTRYTPLTEMMKNNAILWSVTNKNVYHCHTYKERVSFEKAKRIHAAKNAN